MNIQEISETWQNEEPIYRKLGIKICAYIKSTISELGILPEISCRTKDLISIIKKIKKKSKDRPYSYSDINDKLGIRIICNFQDEMDLIDQYLCNNFEIKKVERKRENIGFDRLDYISNHYDACIKPSISRFKPDKHLREKVFEIQVRTLNQHAWANTAHYLSYKQEADIPMPLKRKIYRLLSLYEIADDEITAINNSILHQPGNEAYKLLRILETKIYRYAQIDYDRELSLDSLTTILSFLNIDQKAKVYKHIEEFINENEEKIKNIFKENKSRFHELAILTQPEVFLTWFCLEKFPYAITDNWESKLDIYDLDQIKTLWGSSFI